MAFQWSGICCIVCNINIENIFPPYLFNTYIGVQPSSAIWINIETDHFLIMKHNSKNSTAFISEDSLTFGPGIPCPGSPLEPGGPFGPSTP